MTRRFAANSVSKHLGGLQALLDVSFAIEVGRVLAVMRCGKR